VKGPFLPRRELSGETRPVTTVSRSTGPVARATGAFALSIAVVATLQAVGVAFGGRLGGWTTTAAWLSAGALTIAASIVAALRLGPSRARTAWLLWGVAAGLWVAGAAVRSAFPEAGAPSAADGLWWAFAMVSLAALVVRAPAVPATRLFFLDAFPLVALAALGIHLLGGDSHESPLAEEIAESIYAGLYALLCLSVLQFLSLPGTRGARRATFVGRAFFGLAWALFAAAGFAWAWATLERGGSSDHWTAALWTAGFLVLAGWAWQRGLQPSRMATYTRPVSESGRRALVPVVGIAGLLAVEIAGVGAHAAVKWFLLAGLLAVAARFYLLRRETGRSQTALRESERRFRSVFDSAAVGMVLISRDGRLLESNGNLERMLGYLPGELDGIRAGDITHPGYREESARLYRELELGERDSFVQEKLYLTRDGDPLWARVTGSLIRDERDEPLLTVAVVENIDAQKRTTELFRQRDSVLAAVASCANRLLHAPDWGRVIDDVLRELGESAEVSRAYVFRRHEDESGELCVSQIAEWTAPGVSAELDNPDLQGRRPQGVEREWMATLERGEIVQGHVRDFDPVFRELLEVQGVKSLVLVPIVAAGAWWGYLGFDDCARHREWEAVETETLRAAADMLGAAVERRRVEERYRTLVERLPLVTYIDALDDASSNIYTSPQIEAMLGYTVEEWQSDPELFVKLLHPDDRQRVLAEVARTNEAGEPFVCEYRLLARDGRIVWLRDEAVTVYDEDGLRAQAQGCLLDITDRKLAEEQLRRSRAILEAVEHAAEALLRAESWADTADDVLRTLGTAADTSRAYLFQNERLDDGRLVARQIHEWVAAGVRPMLGDPLTEEFDFAETGFQRWVDVLGAGGVLHGPARMFTEAEQREFRRQGVQSILAVPVVVGGRWWGFLGFDDCREERAWGEAEVEALRAAAGILGAAIQRRQAEGELRETTQMLQALVSASPAPIVGFDKDGRVILWNPAAQRVFGWAEWEVLGRFNPLVDDSQSEDFLRWVGRAMEGKTWRDVEVVRRRKDGTSIDISVSSAPLPDASGRIVGMVSVIIDVTERRHAEQALVHSEERHRTLVENIPGAVYRCAADADWTMEFLSEDIETITGYPASDFTRNEVRTFASVIHPEDHDRISLQVEEGIRLRRPFVCEYRVVRANGEVRWVYEKGTPVLDPDGEALWLDGVIVDITERRRAEFERERLLAALEEQNERLLALDKLKDEFVALVSHELRTPLTSIMGYLELVLDGEGGPVTDDQVSFLEVIKRNSQRLLRLVGDLLFVAQIDAGKLSLETAPVDLEGVVRDCLEAALPRAAEKGVEVLVSADDVPQLEADRVRLAQVLDNLVSNAIKFTPEGGRVEVGICRRNGSVVVTVADTGIGISEDEQARLFERFFRTESAYQLAIQGTGLGLTIVKAIVEAHGGSVTVQSEVGKGTTFAVELPAGEDA
jgi:PAS domain S-box-containing protein